jgi:nitrogen fixation protein NifU and related proteins
VSTEWENLQKLMKVKMEEDYSKVAIEHMLNPKNLGSLSDPDARASVTSANRDNMEMWLKVREGKVEELTFRSWGCGVTIACGSMTTELVRGMTLPEALAVSPEIILTNLGGLPDEHHHSAEVACLALKKVIAEYLGRPEKRAVQAPKRTSGK